MEDVTNPVVYFISIITIIKPFFRGFTSKFTQNHRWDISVVVESSR